MGVGHDRVEIAMIRDISLVEMFRAILHHIVPPQLLYKYVCKDDSEE